MDENKVVEQEKAVINPLDYVTIPITEYRELVEAVARKKLKKEFKQKVKEIEDKKDMYYRWYHEEREKREQLEEVWNNAKSLIKQNLGIDPDTESLAELQFEKGVVCSEQSE